LPLTEEKIEQKVIELVNLPTLPGILMKISRMTESKESGAADVAKLLSSDQVLSAKVLRLVNSPVYGFPGRISTVTHAVVLLGFNVIKGMVLGTSVFDAFGRHAQGFYAHSLGCAIIARRVAKQMNLKDVEEVMIAGLLHDLGKVVLAYLFPNDYDEATRLAEMRGCHISETEREVIGVDHTRVNRWLSAQWHFPDRLGDPIKFHHLPDLSKKFREVTAIVHVADILTRGMGYGFPCDHSMPNLNHEAFQMLPLSFDEYDKVLEDAEMEFAAGVDLFMTTE
jgi:putative nucleotidyltransferase with HDIG domain